MIKGYYINLIHRLDRHEHIKKLQKQYPFFKNIERFDAIFEEKYGVGVCLSHIKCLENCLEKNDCNYYLIMEDDLDIMNDSAFENFVNNFNKINNDDNWDVITLTPYGKTMEKNYKENFHRIIDTQTATGYIIKHDFIPKLLPELYKGLDGLLKGYDGPNPNPYVCDQCWKPLQQKSIWIFFNEVFARQLPSYSDIEKRNVDYTSCFLRQKM